MYAFAGTVTEKLALPEDIFGLKVNKKLLAQAIRVYTTNEQSHNSNTKTRGEVEGSTRKIYKQKGTGNARHGAIRAPIFVGGGIALGPKSRKTVLELPKKMKKAALLAALSQKASEGEVFGITDLEKATGKTAQMSKLFGRIAKKSILIIDGGLNEKALRASGNLQRVNFTTADRLNALEVIRHKSLILTKSAVEKFKTKSEPFDSAQDKGVTK